MMRLTVLATAAAIAGGLGLAPAATAAPLAPASAGVVAGDAVPTNVTCYGYGYRPYVSCRLSDFYGPCFI